MAIDSEFFPLKMVIFHSHVKVYRRAAIAESSPSIMGKTNQLKTQWPRTMIELPACGENESQKLTEEEELQYQRCWEVPEQHWHNVGIYLHN